MMPDVIAQADGRTGPFDVLTAVSAALLALCLVWALVDPRLIGGAPVWAKPAKFSVSFVVHFGTLALIAATLSPAWRQGTLISVTAGVMAVCFLAEMAYMIVMAAQGQASHFNTATPFTSAMYSLMGVGAVLLILGPVMVAAAVWQDGSAQIGPATRAGILWGAALSFVLTFVIAGYMGGNGSHLVGVPGPEARSLPFFGWSASVGDLRPAHFAALHALQALPLLGLLLDRAQISPAFAVPLAALAYAALTLALFAQALMGLPLIRL